MGSLHGRWRTEVSSPYCDTKCSARICESCAVCRTSNDRNCKSTREKGPCGGCAGTVQFLCSVRKVAVSKGRVGDGLIPLILFGRVGHASARSRVRARCFGTSAEIPWYPGTSPELGFEVW